MKPVKESVRPSVAHGRCEPDFMAELRVVCAIAGQWGIGSDWPATWSHSDSFKPVTKFES